MTRLSPLSNAAFFPALVAVLSHELGSPLAAIRGAATTLIDYRQRLPDEQVEGFLQSIDAQIDRLNRLHDDLVRLALQIIEEVCGGLGSLGETSGRIRLVAPPLAVPLDRLAQQYARGTAGIGTDQLWAMLGQYGVATLPDGELY